YTHTSAYTHNHTCCQIFRPLQGLGQLFNCPLDALTHMQTHTQTQAPKCTHTHTHTHTHTRVLRCVGVRFTHYTALDPLATRTHTHTHTHTHIRLYDGSGSHDCFPKQRSETVLSKV